MMILTADTITGVSICERGGVDLLEPETFYKALPKLQEGEVIYTQIEDSSTIFDKISEEYGVTQ
jgi:hypothetical protein